MPDSLLFDGTDDEVRFSLGNGNVTGAFSMAAVVKRGAEGTNQQIMGNSDTLPVQRAGFIFEVTSNKLKTTVSGRISTTTVVVADGWVLVALTKAAGTVTPRFHIYNYGTATWVHEDASGTIANPVTAAGGDTRLGEQSDAFDFDGNILIAATWGSELSDAAVELLALGGLPAWEAANPLEGWRFDTTSAISSFASGGTSAETVRNGTTLDTGDAPADWYDEIFPLPLGLFDPDLVPQAWF